MWGFQPVKKPWEQVFIQVLRFSHVNIIPLLLHIDSYTIWEMGKRSVRAPVPETKSHVVTKIIMCYFL